MYVMDAALRCRTIIYSCTNVQYFRWMITCRAGTYKQVVDGRMVISQMNVTMDNVPEVY